jgi:hypothetical protein
MATKTKKRIRTKKESAEGKVIYVLLPHTVQYETMDKFEDKKLSAGMLAAQTGHVVSCMRTESFILKRYGRQPITTLTFSVRNSKEMDKVRRDLDALGVNTWTFYDKNPGFYGTSEDIPTAVCTEPVFRSWVASAIDHLELYKEIHSW